MKMKSIAALGMTALLAASVAYFSPVFAADPNDPNDDLNDQAMQQAFPSGPMADNSGITNSGAAPDSGATTDPGKAAGSMDNSSLTPDVNPNSSSVANTPSQDTTPNSNAAADNTPSNAAGNEQGSPDTATGDDDY